MILLVKYGQYKLVLSVIHRFSVCEIIWYLERSINQLNFTIDVGTYRGSDDGLCIVIYNVARQRFL